jgi:hypothetical protein
VFTDEDLADRFVRSSGFAGLPVPADTPAEFLTLAATLPPVCTHVAFDPPPRVGSRARWVVTLAEVLRAVKAAEE